MSLRGYVAAAAVLALCTVLSLENATAFVIALPVGVLAITVQFGVGPAVFMAATSVLVFDFVFVPPAFVFNMPGFKDGLTVAVMFAVATAAAVLAEQLRRQVLQARRQAEVEHLRNALLSALSHDLKTPLTALVGAGNALYEDRLDPRERREFARVVAEEAARLSRLVGNLLELTRLESGGLVAKQVPQVIDEVIGAVLYRLERQLDGRQVTTNVPEDVPLVPFDPVLIEQVLRNLLENVMRHTPAGTPIDIDVQRREDSIELAVGDRGPGVPPGDEERVFEKLYRAPGAKGDGGVGLGLTICRAILTAHDGRIWLENREGGGALVRLTLPIRRSPRSLPRATVPPIPEMHTP